MPLQFPPAQYEIHESSPADPTAPNTLDSHRYADAHNLWSGITGIPPDCCPSQMDSVQSSQLSHPAGLDSLCPVPRPRYTVLPLPQLALVPSPRPVHTSAYSRSPYQWECLVHPTANLANSSRLWSPLSGHTDSQSRPPKTSKLGSPTASPTLRRHT